MEFTFKNKNITISSEKKNIVLGAESVILDEFVVDVAGEYEKSGFLLYARTSQEITYYHFRAEGLWIGYIPTIPAEIEASIAEFFGQLDILVAPFSKNEKKFLDQIEPKMLVTFSENGADLASVLGEAISSGNNYKLKVSDISTEKTSLVLLSE